MVRSPPAGLVQGQGLGRVAVHRLHQGALVPALGDAQVHAGAAQLAEPVLHVGLDGGRQLGDEHLAGHALAGLAAVDLQQQLLDEFGGADVLDLLGDPAALAADASTADVEHLHGGLELVVGDGEDVGVGGVGQDDGGLLQGLGEGAEVVPEAGRALVVHLGGGGLHLALGAADELGGVAGHEVAEVLREVLVVLADTLPTQGAEHLSMYPSRQGRPTWPARLKTPVEHVRTGKTRSSRSTVSRMAQAWV